MNFLPNRLFAPAPIKRKFDGGEAMKDTWATEKRSRRTGVAMKVDAQGHKHSRIFSVTKNWRRRFQTKVAGARFRGDVPGQGYDSSHPAASDNGEGVSNLWLREYSSDKESILYFKRPPGLAASDDRIMFSRDENAAPYHGGHTNRKRGNSFLADRETSGEANHQPTQANATRRPHLLLCFEESTTRLD